MRKGGKGDIMANSNEGIIFGQHFLDKEQFMEIMKPWYEQKFEDFKQALQIEIIQPLESMWSLTRLKSKNKNGNYYKFIKHKEGYDTKKIYDAWMRINQNYFGNDEVQLIAVINMNNKEESMWTTSIKEGDMITEKSKTLSISANKLNQMQEKIGNILLCQDIESIMQDHYANLLKTLDEYHMSKREARYLHILLGARKSNLIKEKRVEGEKEFFVKLNAEHFTNKTYNQTLFRKAQEGKKLDAFMNHMANAHTQIYGLMSNSQISIRSAENMLNSIKTSINKEGGFEKVFKNKPVSTQRWLYDSLNTTSWLTGGDVVVVNDEGKVIYNIQIKGSIKNSANWELSSKELLNFAQSIIREVDSPEKLAEIMFEKLKTQTSNKFKVIEEHMTEKIYKDTKEKLKLI